MDPAVLEPLRDLLRLESPVVQNPRYSLGPTGHGIPEPVPGNVPTKVARDVEITINKH